MEHSGPLILEISSDEETGFGDSKKGSGCGGEIGDGEDGEWLSKLLGEVGGNIDDDSDDVVFVSEVLPKAPKKSRSDSFKPSAKVVVDDDDDCVVLDGDPDKPIVVVNRKVDNVDVDDSDDLEIVGEKGEVACRDFPHPRHLCAKFLFASTPHESHCGQCHCYVCDSLAPCLHWGTGISSVDHCHASDKEEYWRAERKRVKQIDKPVPVISTIGTSRIEAFFPTIQVPALARPQQNFLAQNQEFNPVTAHPRLMSSNVSVPNDISQVRTHPSGHAVPRYRPQSQSVSLHSHPTSNSHVAARVASMNKSHHVGSQNPQSFPPHAVFKQNGFVGASPNNRHAYGSQLSRDPSLKRCRAFQAPVISGRHSSNQQNVGSQTVGSVITSPELSSFHSTNVRRANYSPSQPRIHSRPYSGYLNRDPIHYQSQMPSQPYLNRNFSSGVPLQPSISSQPSTETIKNPVLPPPHVFQPDNPASSQFVASNLSDAGYAFGSQLHSRSMTSSPLSPGINLEDYSSQPHSSQPQPYNNPTSLLLIDDQYNVQRGSQTQNGADVSPTDFSFLRDPSPNNGNLQMHAEESQYRSTALAGTSLLQNGPRNDHHPSIAPVDNLSRQIEFLADHTSPINDADCQFPGSAGPDPLDLFDNWTFENQSLSGGVDGSASPSWNVFSPEPAFVDTATLFDVQIFRE